MKKSIAPAPTEATPAAIWQDNEAAQRPHTSLIDEEGPPGAVKAGGPAYQQSVRLLARIPVEIALEVGSTTISLADLLALRANAVLELNRAAGDPLIIKVNGTIVGRGEVVVSGDQYAVRVLDLDDLSGLDRAPEHQPAEDKADWESLLGDNLHSPAFHIPQHGMETNAAPSGLRVPEPEQ